MIQSLFCLLFFPGCENGKGRACFKTLQAHRYMKRYIMSKNKKINRQHVALMFLNMIKVVLELLKAHKL